MVAALGRLTSRQPPHLEHTAMDQIPTTLDPDFDELEPWDLPETRTAGGAE